MFPAPSVTAPAALHSPATPSSRGSHPVASHQLLTRWSWLPCMWFVLGLYSPHIPRVRYVHQSQSGAGYRASHRPAGSNACTACPSTPAHTAGAGAVPGGRKADKVEPPEGPLRNPPLAPSCQQGPLGVTWCHHGSHPVTSCGQICCTTAEVGIQLARLGQRGTKKRCDAAAGCGYRLWHAIPPLLGRTMQPCNTQYCCHGCRRLPAPVAEGCRLHQTAAHCSLPAVAREGPAYC
jgi:hypothetical protein